MPRTAATTFELSVAPYLGEDVNSFLAPFSILFFVIVYLITCRKSRVVDIIGAVVMLGLVYGGLTYLGATLVSLGTGMSQVGLLVAIVESVLGDAGKILLSAIVALACVTTAVALVSSAADFFSRLFKNKISYQALLIIDCVIGTLICDISLDNIIRFADPVLGVVYPPFITVVVFLIFGKQIKLCEVY